MLPVVSISRFHSENGTLRDKWDTTPQGLRCYCSFGYSLGDVLQVLQGVCPTRNQNIGVGNELGLAFGNHTRHLSSLGCLFHF